MYSRLFGLGEQNITKIIRFSGIEIVFNFFFFNNVYNQGWTQTGTDDHYNY